MFAEQTPFATIDPHYSDRVVHPGETVARMRALLSQLGITRLARQTDLDEIGIPCFAAFRPNSRSLSVNQGKGLTDDDARASAIMEAAEFAVAEAPRTAQVRNSADDLTTAGESYFDPVRSLPFGSSLSTSQPLNWVAGTDLHSGQEILVPVDLIALGTCNDLPGICQSTNGLASGNTAQEAIFHGLCELVERDAATMWSLMPVDAQARRCIDPASLADVAVDELCAKFARAGVALKLFDLTTDIGTPTIMALAGDQPQMDYGLIAGYGTHPVAARAAIRAITEAAQGRVTAIASARDDIDISGYRDMPDAGLVNLTQARPVALAPRGMSIGTPLGAMIDSLLGVLSQRGIDVTAVSLGAEAMGFSVVRLLSNALEDRGPNKNWRPGIRALSFLAFQ